MHNSRYAYQAGRPRRRGKPDSGKSVGPRNARLGLVAELTNSYSSYNSF